MGHIFQNIQGLIKELLQIIEPCLEIGTGELLLFRVDKFNFSVFDTLEYTHGGIFFHILRKVKFRRLAFLLVLTYNVCCNNKSCDIFHRLLLILCSRKNKRKIGIAWLILSEICFVMYRQ